MSSIQHIVLAMKPTEGNFVENALKCGVTGLNIDGCRIGYVSSSDAKHQSDIARGQDNAVNGRFFGGNGKSIASTHTPSGRFPANVILGHSEGCKRVGTKKVKCSQLHQVIERSKSNSDCFGKQSDGYASGYAGADGKEEVDDWDCVEGCPVKAIGEQSGELKSNGEYKKNGVWGNSGEGEIRTWDVAYSKLNKYAGEKGTAARFFKQVSKFQEEE